jgi:hypothetical protein
MSCTYCNEKGFIHVYANDIIDVLYGLSKKDRVTVLKFIKQTQSKTHHSAVAEIVIENTFCDYCGSDMERDDDGDRYYYLCTNMKCECWNK